MEYKKGDRVIFVRHPGSPVTEWLMTEQIPGTVYKVMDCLVFVEWDGLRDKVRSTWEGTQYDRGDTDSWSVHESQIVHLYGDGVESVGDTSGLVTSIFNNL